MGLTKIDDRGLKTPIDLLDNEKIRLGTGNDLKLYHDGTESTILSVTGGLVIKDTGGYMRIRSDELKIQSESNETYIEADANGAVQLFYDNTKKFETSSVGATVTGQLHVNSGYINVDDNYAYGMGTNNRAQLYHDGSNLHLLNTVGSTYIQPKTGENGIQLVPDGTVKLYYDNSAKFETTSAGVTVTGKVGIGLTPSVTIETLATNSVTWGSLPETIITYGNTSAYNSGSAGAGIQFGGYFNTNPNHTIFGGIHGVKENTTNGEYGGALLFSTRTNGSGSSERMRIDSSGNVIIGGASLNNSAVSGQALQINGTTRPTLILRGNASGSNTAEIQFADNSGSDDDNTGIRAGLIKYDHSNNSMSFRVAGTYTGLKISGTNGRLERNFTGGSNTDDDGMWFNNSGSTSGTYIRFWQTTAGANQIGSISHSTSATAYNTSSDYRLKENATAISDGITRLKTLKPYRFNFKVTPKETVDGFFAHEVTAVPEAITGTKDEVDSDENPIYQGIDQSKLVPLLTAALQEAITKIETLETKVAALEAA